jgi:hypothetical protein
MDARGPESCFILKFNVSGVEAFGLTTSHNQTYLSLCVFVCVINEILTPECRRFVVINRFFVLQNSRLNTNIIIGGKYFLRWLYQ